MLIHIIVMWYMTAFQVEMINADNKTVPLKCIRVSLRLVGQIS